MTGNTTGFYKTMAIPVSSSGSDIWTQTTKEKGGHYQNKVAKTIRRIQFIGPQAQNIYIRN